MSDWLRHLRVTRSLRRDLLIGILLPIALFVVVDTVSVYRQALAAVNVAYDRTLLASAKSIGELLEIEGEGSAARIRARVPYAALEAFEADNRSRMVYRISDARGQWLDGDAALTAWQGTLPQQGPYAALVDFYDDQIHGEAVRVAVLLQPVATAHERAMATVQVAETLELRHTLARQILLDTLQRQALLIAVIAAVVWFVVQRVTSPVRQLSRRLDQRSEDDLTPIYAPELPGEIQPLTEAANRVMSRLQHLLDHQQRFVRDAAHQLRTPLAVLKVQVQSALRGDLAPHEALQGIEATVNRATQLTNQMLTFAKVEQLRQQQSFEPLDWAESLRALVLEMSPLIAEKDLDFELDAQVCLVQAHEWMLREMVRNFLHNAIRHSPLGGTLLLRLKQSDGVAMLLIRDAGGGISEELRVRLFQPFATAGGHAGAGLGLTIAREIAVALGGTVQLQNRVESGVICGLDASIGLPMAGSLGRAKVDQST